MIANNVSPALRMVSTDSRVERCGRLVCKLLGDDAAQDEAGQLELEKQPFDLEDWCAHYRQCWAVI